MYKGKEQSTPPPGFEPGSRARQARILGRAILRRLLVSGVYFGFWLGVLFFMVLLFVLSLSGFVCFIMCLVVSVVAEFLEKAERVAECIRGGVCVTRTCTIYR